MIIRNQKYLDQGGKPSDKMLKSCIKENETQKDRLDKLENYFIGKHKIEDRKMQNKYIPNNKITCNHARIISITAASHLVGQPVKYQAKDGTEKAFEQIQATFNLNDIPAVDSEIEQDCSVFGRGVELVYMSSDENPIPKSTQLDPRSAFVVYDDTVEHKRIFGVHYYKIKNEDGEDNGYKVNLYTRFKKYSYTAKDLQGNLKPAEESPEEYNLFGDVPLIEYLNNEEEKGDFEGQIGLIDAYNMLQSDRINDKEAFVDAILIIKGQSFGDTLDDGSETLQKLQQLRLLELDETGEAAYLTKQMVEADVDILKRSISEDIHRFSMVPNIADENFAGNASGVAMSYKLFLLEKLTNIKERYFRRSLRERLKLYANIFNVKTGDNFRIGDIDITFTHSLPINMPEIAGIVSSLDGIVPRYDLYKQIPFIEDPQAALDRLDEQKMENVEKTRNMFGGGLPDMNQAKAEQNKREQKDKERAQSKLIPEA